MLDLQSLFIEGQANANWSMIVHVVAFYDKGGISQHGTPTHVPKPYYAPGAVALTITTLSHAMWDAMLDFKGS